jgi:hypothetical protein
MKSALNLVAGIFGFAGYWLLGSNLQERLAVALGILLIAVPSLLLGWLIGKFTRARIDVEGDGAQIFAWTSLVFWIFPVFGLIVAQIVSVWADASDRHATRYLVLSHLGVLAALVNCALGVMSGIAASQALTG